jgi:hypothetical protein
LDVEQSQNEYKKSNTWLELVKRVWEVGEYCSLDTLQVATLVSANNHGKKKQQDASFSQGPGIWGIWANIIIGCNHQFNSLSSISSDQGST